MWREQLRTGEDDGERGLSRFLSSWRQGVFSSSPLLKNKAAKPFSRSCRSGAEAQAAASKLGQPANCVPNARRALWSAQLHPHPPPGGAAATPCCLFRPLGRHKANPALLSIFFFFFFLPLPGCLPTHCYIQIKRRSPFFSASPASGRSSALSPRPLLTMPGTPSSAVPVRSPLWCASP